MNAAAILVHLTLCTGCRVVLAGCTLQINEPQLQRSKHQRATHQRLSTSNVKRVKEQTFQKRSTNVPIFNRNETKNHWVLSRICLIERDPFYLAQESRFWTKKKSKQSVFNKRNSGTISKRFGFASKMISERLSFRFWHYYSLLQPWVVEAHSTLALPKTLQINGSMHQPKNLGR